MKKLITLLIIIASFGCSNQNNTGPEYTMYFDTLATTISYNAIFDSTAWIAIDTVYGDTLLTIDNSNYYRWYKIETVGIGGPMVIHGTWINHKDSTITEFTLTE